MEGKLMHVTVPANFLLLHLVLLLPIISHGFPLIPADPAQIGSWTSANIQRFQAATAENGVTVIKVRKDGTGDFKTLTDAVKSIPSGNTKRTIIWIGPGEYREKVKVDRTKPFVTFYGSPGNMTKLSYDGTAAKYGTLYSATIEVESDDFMAVNIIFVNTAPEPDGKRAGSQAVAMRIAGDRAAFYNCKFIGFQDTLCDDIGNHFFKDCYIEGTIDFIFGNGKSIYLNTEIHSKARAGFAAITAQANELQNNGSGFSFVHCKITGTGNTYLGRAWMPRSRVVFAYTYMDSLVHPAGWYDRGITERAKTVFYGEYKCMGPGANTSKRVSYTKMLTDEEAKPFLNMNFINADSWLRTPPKL